MLYKQPTSKYWYAKLKHHGKTVRRSTRETNRRAAEKVHNKWRDELKSLRKQSDHTFADAAIRWLREKEHKKSIEGDKRILKWFGYHLAHLYLSEITRDKIEEVRNLKLQEASKSTVNSYMRCLKSVLRIARDDWQWLDTVPPIPMYKTEGREPRFLSRDQFQSLMTELPPHLELPAWFAVSTGLRTGAIQSLRWDWISRDGLRVPPEVQKNDEWLTVPLSRDAWNAIALCWGNHPTYVFVNHLGQPFAEKFTKGAWKKAAIRADLEGVKFHDLRHTFASWMLQRGIPEHVIMELGGWKTRKAFKIYAGHTTESINRLAGWVQNLDERGT